MGQSKLESKKVLKLAKPVTTLGAHNYDKFDRFDSLTGIEKIPHRVAPGILTLNFLDENEVKTLRYIDY